MENKEKYNYICFDGIDKCGKDTIAKYFDYINRGRFIVKSRGIMSLWAYNKLYARNRQYNIDESTTLNVYLTVNYEDWKIRCKMNNEPIIDYDSNVKVFDDIYDELLNKNVTILKFDTSTMTQYEIAKAILGYINHE